MQLEYREKNYFNYKLFMQTEDYISLKDFNEEDQQKIIEYNGCGNIIFDVKTKFKHFQEKWLFNNKNDKIEKYNESLIPIWPNEVSSTKNLELVGENELVDIKLFFEPYTNEMIEDILENNKNKLDNHLEILSSTDEMKFSCFDKESQDLFKKYGGKGLIIRTIYTRMGRTFQEIWEFDFVDRDVKFNDLNDDTILHIYSESLDNKLNYELYPQQDFLRDEYHFKPFLDDEYEMLNNTVEDFDFDDYKKNYNEIIEGYNFTDEDYELIEKNKTKGYVYYEFKTIKNEIIRDYYEINMMYKHDINRELDELGKNLDLSQFSEKEIKEIKKSYDYYDFEIIPFYFGKRNNFTVPEIEKFGRGHWYYLKDKKKIKFNVYD